MKRIVKLSLWLLLIITNAAIADDQIIKELDATWAELARTVAEGDFEGYKKGYHQDAILVSGFSKDSYPIAKALASWKSGFDDTKAKKMTAGVDFYFTQRLHDQTTAHETGMFRYYTTDKQGKQTEFIAHMNALLIKKEGKWLIMMEYQKSQMTRAQWDALK
ncbi:MAG: DUF4440 domain-containing protein [Colwellia sp.]|nr:DUF4440 domain-containing protein [Colwellia sp.]